MPLSNVGGPLVIGQTSGDPDFGPNLGVNGWGLMDPRLSYKNGGAGILAVGFKGNNHIPVISAVPSAISTTAISAAAAPTTNVPLVLVSTSGAGITVTSTSTTVLPNNNVVPSGALVIDSLPGTVFTSSSGATQLYDPTKAVARAVSIAVNGNDGTGSYVVKGYDIYGFPMSEAIPGPGSSSTVTGNKAFKFITSITPTGTIASTLVSAGQSDKYGFPLRADFFGDVEILWNSAVITSNAGFVGAVATTATPSTGDVRGTYAVQASASDGTKRLQIFSTPSVADLLTTAGLFGVSQA